jgi:ribokinase
MDKLVIMNGIEVVGLGALNIDYLYQVDRILEDGETVVKESGLFPGGSAANTIYGLARLGVGTSFLGAVGDDTEGKILQKDFQKAGVATDRIIIKPKIKTGSVLCLSDRLGRRSLYVLPGANNRLTIDDLDLTYLNQAKVLHISSFAADNQLRMLLKLIERIDLSVKLSFAPGALYAVKGLKALSPILSRTHLLFLNQNEMRQLTGKDVTSGSESCIRQGCQIVVVTLGKGEKEEQVREGVTTVPLGKPIQERIGVCYIRDNERPEGYYILASSSAIKPVIDTTGAGDAFATGFLYGLLKEKSLDECGRLGDIVAQFCITKIGVRGGLPNSTQLAQRYQQLYGKKP